jgi:molybdenum cofactor cytidylyltransferase
MTFAVIPAAGKSARMGRPKLALPLGGATVLEHVISALRGAGVGPILVVAGPHVAELAILAEAGGAHALVLPQETEDMRATVEAGLSWLEDHFCPRPEDDWLLVPGDHPTLAPAIIRSLLAARQWAPAGTILVPIYQGRRGHPTLIPWRHVAGIRALPPGQGINVYLRAHQEAIMEVQVPTEEILVDLDTPEDYRGLRQRWQGK